MNDCKHCSVGKENEYGDIWFGQFPMSLLGGVYHSAPRILKRNNRYFLDVDDFRMIQIKACPICGRNFEEKDNDQT